MKTVELDELLHSDNASDWGKALFALGRDYGFDRVLFAMSGSRHARLDNAFVQTNYPAKWRERYDAERMAYIDPIISHCLQSTLPLIWPSDLFRTQAQRLLYEDARAHGLRAGATFPIHGPNGEFGILSFAVDQEADPAWTRAVMGAAAGPGAGARLCVRLGGALLPAGGPGGGATADPARAGSAQLGHGGQIVVGDFKDYQLFRGDGELPHGKYPAEVQRQHSATGGSEGDFPRLDYPRRSPSLSLPLT
jgi:hypothetical protein